MSDAATDMTAFGVIELDAAGKPGPFKVLVQRPDAEADNALPVLAERDLGAKLPSLETDLPKKKGKRTLDEIEVEHAAPYAAAWADSALVHFALFFGESILLLGPYYLLRPAMRPIAGLNGY